MYKLTLEDFRKHLSTQIRFLQNSVKAYDEGFEDEAQRMSATLRVLFHNTKDSTALINHLEINNQLLLISSTAQYIPSNMCSYLGFITLRTTVGKGGEYVPNCLIEEDMPNKWICFNDWWNEIVIDDKSNIFTRKDIILNIANKDGGSHIDERLNTDFAKLTKDNSIGWVYVDENGESPFINNTSYAAVRQIVAEVLLSLDWFLNEKSYTREKLDLNYEIRLINKKVYLCENKSDSIWRTLMLDNRVTNKRIVKCYNDKIKFLNGSVGKRIVFV